MAKDPWSVVSQENASAPDGWSVVSAEPVARRAVNLGEEPPPSGMAGEFAGFADVFAPPQPKQESVLQGRPLRELAIAKDKLLDPAFVDAIRQNVEQMDPAQRQATLTQMARRTDVYGRAAKVLGEHYKEVERSRSSAASTVLARPPVQEEPTFLGEITRGARSALEYGLPSMGSQLGLQGSASAMVARQAQMSLMDRIDQGEFATLQDLKNDEQYQTLSKEGNIGLVNSYFANRGKAETSSKLRNRTQQELTNLVSDTAGHIRTLNQYARENKQKYGPAVEKFTDLDWTNPAVVEDFKNWLGYNMGAGAVQMAPIMLAAVVTKRPGLLATSAGMGVSEAVGARLKFIQEQVKNLPEKERGAAIAKYIADSGDTNLITGLVSGSFDLLLGPAAKAAKASLPQEIGKLAAAKKAAKELPSDIGGEAVTGALQQATQIAAAKKLKEEGRAVTWENIKDVIDSAAAEAAGAPFGTAVNVGMAAAMAPSVEPRPGLHVPPPAGRPTPPAARPRVEPALTTGQLAVPPEERKELTLRFEPLETPPAAPAVEAIPGMPTGQELEEPAPPPAAEPVAPTAPVVKPTQAAAALPETPVVPPVTAPKAFEPTAPQHASTGMPIQEIPLTDLRLSKDVPQFKIGASEKGVVEPLGGKFERTGVAPIQVWRRLDGSLEVISGRHRFDLAQRSGEKTIPAQIHDEASGFGPIQAATLDAELNIRDGQGKVKDYVNFFKESGIDRQAADAKGLLARATGKRSFTIANQGSDELIAAVRADQIGDEAAYYVALNAPGDARLQGVGIKAIMDGKSMNTAVNIMQAVKALASEQDTTTDLFGYDDSALREAEEMAKIAAKNQKSIQARLSAITGASKNPELAKQEGIDIRDPEAVQRRIGELRQMKAAWDNWNTSPELIAQIREERGQPAPKPVITAQTEEELRQKAEREAAEAKRVADERLAAERKAKADAERDEFVLTGSDRAADEAAARGQADIFGAPEEAPPAKLDPIKVIDKYVAKLKEQTAKESYETTDDRLVKTQTYELDETISRAEFDALVGESNVTPQKRGNKYAITLVDTENASSILTFNARGLTPTQQQVEVFMQLQTSEVVKPEEVAPGELPAEKPETSQEDKDNAEVHAQEIGGEVVWQKGPFALVRGYSILTGDPVYAPTMGESRAGVDIEGFTGAQIPEDVKQEMIAAKKAAEKEAEDKHKKSPFIKFKDGVAVSEGISPEIEGIIRGWKDILKLDVPIYVGTIEDARRHKNDYTGPHRRIGSGTLNEGERGSARRMSDGSYYILFKESTSPTLMLETIAHEMGHIHEKLVFENATPEEKQALRDAHQKWLATQKDKTAQELVNALRARATQRKTKVPEGMTADQLTSYWRSFGEWYADQVSRWAVSGVVPVGVVEKFFKRLGNQLRRFYQVLKNAKYLPNETFVQYIEKVTSRPPNLAPDTQDVSSRMVEGLEPIKSLDVLQNIEPKDKGEQSGFAFDINATDQIAKSNPTVAENLARANQLPGAKKKLPPGRSPELAAAAQQVQAGLMTAQEFDALVNKYKPIPVYFAPLKPATSDQVYNALDVAKREKINPDIKEGYPVGLRLDIPAFNRHGVYVVSIHEKRTPSAPGKVIGYGSVARITDVTFGVGNQREALKIATGEAKDAIQTMEGKYVPITPEQAYEIADSAILSGDWVQMGIDPTRHAYFFDRRTTLPVVAAKEVIQIGNMILARGVTFGKKEEFLYNIAAEPSLAEQEGELEFGNTRVQQIRRYAALRRAIGTATAKVAKGEISIDMQRNLTQMIQESRALQAAIKATAPRRDSAERFMAKALQEYDDGNISAEVLAVVQQVYQQYPDLLEGLLLSVKQGKGKDAAGSFAQIQRIISLYKGTAGVERPTTIRHELAHSLEQMMTPEQANVVVQAWGKALARAIKQNPDELHQRYFKAVLDFIANPSVKTFKEAQRLLPSYAMYQFINPSEYWAINAEKLLNAQLGSAWERFKKAVGKLFEAIKNIFGFNNTYAVHKIFDQVMGGKRERLTDLALVDMVVDLGGDFITLNNIQDEKDLMDKYSRPKTPMLDTSPIKTFITRQFKNGKEFFSDAAKNPKEAMIGTGTAVIDGLIYARNKNVWYGSGLEARDFDRYNGELRTSEGLATASVALDNAIRSGNVGVEVIFRGGLKFDADKNNFVAVETKKGMKGVYEAEAALKKKLGDQLGTDIIQGYLEAKRSISIMDELYEREAALEDAKQNLEAMRALKRSPEEIAIAEAAKNDAQTEVEAIKKAVSSVNMSEEEMAEFAALDQKHPELRDMMDNWTAINQNLLKVWRQVGLLSEGRYERLSAIKDYVPWYRIMNDEEDVHSPIQSTTRTLSNIGREKLFKRGKPISVVDFRAKEGQKDFKIQPSSVVKVKVNGQAVNPDLVSVTPSGEVRIDMDLQDNDLVVFETNREIENIVDNMTRNVMRMTMNAMRQYAANRIVLEYASRNEKGKIMVFPSVDKDKGRFNWIVNGKKVVVEIQDPLVAASIYGMENLNLQMWAPLAAVANFTRRTITLSGVFQIKQVFKDAPTAALVTGVKNPLALIGGVYKGFLTSLTNTDPVVDILKAAGIGGYMSPARTPEAEIKRRLGIMNRNVFDFVIKGLDHIGDASDMAQRVATYKRVMAETGDETQALYQAANVINFLHHGSAGYAQAIVKVVPFMGAYANATDVLVRSLVGGGLKGVSRKKALLRLGITVAMLTSLTLLYCMLAGADPEYDEIDDQTKLRNVMIPGTKIMLPMNTSAAYFFKAIPELIYNKVTRDGTDSEMDRRRLRQALGEAARDMLLGPEPIPAGVKPILEVVINHNFFTGKPVIPQGMKDLEAAEQYTGSTSELGKKLSAMLEIPGTDGKRVISPVEADHLIRGIFGTAGAMGQWISNSIGAMAEVRPEPTARETPITGSFLRPEVPRGREDLFYDFKEQVDKKYKTYMKMVEREDYKAADEYLERNGNVAEMHDYVSETDNELKEINAEIRRIGETRSKDQTPAERRREIEDYQRLKQEILEPVRDLRREAFGIGSLNPFREKAGAPGPR